LVFILDIVGLESNPRVARALLNVDLVDHVVVDAVPAEGLALAIGTGMLGVADADHARLLEGPLGDRSGEGLVARLLAINKSVKEPARGGKKQTAKKLGTKP